jgi:two-component system chemotaxis sensor kinase CheA
MTRTARKKAGKAPAAAVDEELAAFAADPELASMFVADGLEQIGTIERTILKLEAAPGDRGLINDLFRPFHTIKGNAGVLGIRSVEAFSHKIETLLDLARAGSHPLGAAEIDVVLKAVDLLTQMVSELPARAAGASATNISAASEELLATVDVMIANGGSAAADPATPAPSAELPPNEPVWIDDDSTIKVSTRKLDALVDMVGELVIAQAIFAEDPAGHRSADDRLTRQLAQIRRITSDIQRDAMSMRMVPIRRTFQKMERLIRDLSRKLDKPVHVTVVGEETELDRKLVEQLTDPLMHMVRNSIDHGIETVDVRTACGKAPTASIELRAFHRGGGVVVEIADDGAGLDTERIRARALTQGLISDGTSMAPSDVHQLIFAPGFSTAEHVTEVSGRGVGMDIVRRNVQMLRGRIDIQSVRGQGATFSLQLPLTLAIVDGLVLSVGADRFVIPTPAVQESLRPQPQQVHTSGGRPSMVQVRDRLIPLLHLGRAFGISGAKTEIADAIVVIAEDNGRPVAIVVDELLGKREVVIRSLGEMFRGVRGIAGGAILGDGRIGLILDTGGLMALAATTHAQTAA